MAPKGYIDALWVGTPQEMADRTQLVPNETIVAISEGEARASDNWEPVDKPKPRKTEDAD